MGDQYISRGSRVLWIWARLLNWEFLEELMVVVVEAGTVMEKRGILHTLRFLWGRVFGKGAIGSGSGRAKFWNRERF